MTEEEKNNNIDHEEETPTNSTDSESTQNSQTDDNLETEVKSEEDEVEEEEPEPVEMVEIPKDRLEELENAETIFKDQLMRERAESINYRKRLQKQRDEFAEVASARVLSKVLAVKDDIKRLLDNSNGEIPETHLEGIQLIQQRLEGIFNAEGVEIIKIEEGKTKYDPKFMEAVVSQPIPNVDPNTVMGVINQGFKKGDRVLRAAKVMISKAPEKEKEEEVQKSENGDSEKNDASDTAPEQS